MNKLIFTIRPTSPIYDVLAYLATTICLVGLLATASCQQPARSSFPIETITNPSKAGARLPRLSPMPNGAILLSWVEPWRKGHILKFAVRKEGRWIRQGEVAHGEEWFVNWADFPSVKTIDSTFWVAHWLVKHPGGHTFDYDIAISISNDAGVTWSPPKHPHRDGSMAEHGFATIFPVEDEAGIIWLDGRDYKKAPKRQKAKIASGNFALRYSRIDRNGGFGMEQIIDHNTCTCCGTTVANTSTGPVAAWRSRTNTEIRDNQIAHLQDGQWSPPRPLGAEGWEIAGCPVNGPMLAAQGMQVVGAWYTEEGERPRVRAAFSNDGGATFSQPIEVDTSDPIGRIDVAWFNHHTAIVTWITAPTNGTHTHYLALRKLSLDRSIGPIQQVAAISGKRDSGFPQVSGDSSGLLLAWTNATPEYGIQTTWIPTKSLAP